MMPFDSLLFTEPIYQSEWNNISLTDLSEELKIPKNEIQKEDFYRHYYSKLKENNFKISNDWIIKKNKISDTWKSLLDQYHIQKDQLILSVGAGIGIVEKPLIQDGYNITLQECQSNSFAYLEQDSLQFNAIISTDLSQIPNKSYDVITIFYVSYALPYKTYISLIKECHRILKPGGTLMLFDGVCHLEKLTPIKYLRRLIKRCIKPYQSDCIFWGWLRHPYLHKKVIKKAGFALNSSFFTDSSGQRQEPPMFGFKIGNGPLALQWHIAKVPQGLGH